MYIIFLCAALVLFPSAALRGAGLGLEICLGSVVPSLLPFMLLSSILIKSGWGERLGALLSHILKPIFGLDAAASVCFVSGLLGGYPIGARTVQAAVGEGLMSKEDGERALAFCNNSGPLFIIGTAGAAVYSSVRAGVLLYLCHLLGACVSALVFGRALAGAGAAVGKKRTTAPTALVAEAARESGAAIVSVCALVITFSALIEALMLSRLPLVLGIFEVTRGVAALKPFGIEAMPLAAAYLGWGGLSVHLQTDAVAPTLSKKYYYIGKLISASAAAVLCRLCIIFFGNGII